MNNRCLIISLFFVMSTVFTFAQINTDVVGEWYNAEEGVVLTFFEDDEKVSARISWMKFPNDKNGNPKIDSLNPDERLRNREIMGMITLSGFSHIAGKVWDNGSIYDAKKGKNYSGMMTLKDSNTLDLRRYIGFSFIGTSSLWTRSKEEMSTSNGVLTQLKEDIRIIIKEIEDMSLKPAKDIISKVEDEDLLIQLREDLTKVIKKIEKKKGKY